MRTTTELSHWIDESRVERDPQGAQLGVSNTWVSAKHRYLYMAIPKVACSKIKIALQELEGLELPPAPLRIHWRDTAGLSFVQSVSDFSTPDILSDFKASFWLHVSDARRALVLR